MDALAVIAAVVAIATFQGYWLTRWLDARFAAIEQRLTAIDGRLDRIEDRLDRVVDRAPG